MDGWMDETWKEFILKWFRSIQSSPIFLSPFIFYFGISSSQIKKNDWGSTDFSLHVWLWCHNERGKKNKRYDDSFLYICMCIHTYIHTYIYIYIYIRLLWFAKYNQSTLLLLFRPKYIVVFDSLLPNKTNVQFGTRKDGKGSMQNE